MAWTELQTLVQVNGSRVWIAMVDLSAYRFVDQKVACRFLTISQYKIFATKYSLFCNLPVTTVGGTLSFRPDNNYNNKKKKKPPAHRVELCTMKLRRNFYLIITIEYLTASSSAHNIKLLHLLSYCNS